MDELEELELELADTVEDIVEDWEEKAAEITEFTENALECMAEQGYEDIPTVRDENGGLWVDVETMFVEDPNIGPIFEACANGE